MIILFIWFSVDTVAREIAISKDIDDESKGTFNCNRQLQPVLSLIGLHHNLMLLTKE